MKQKIVTRLFCAAVTGCLLVNVLFPMKADAAGYINQADRSFVSQVFDASYYYNTYNDVATVIGNDKDALLTHYINYGIKEGRNASATFNYTTYKNNYADLQKVLGSSTYSYFRHYVEHGIDEGRNAIDVLVAPAEDIELGTVIATYSTYFNPRIARATNVRLAASQVNGKVLQPQETFSFLNSILPRTIENGYVEAPIFVSGKHATGIGGGICQVSSTIYAAITSTTCTINERHSHSLPVNYVPAGMDATVSAPSLDFRFTNTYDQPMLITATTSDDGYLTVTISLK